jgi:hypothetical protein
MTTRPLPILLCAVLALATPHTSGVFAQEEDNATTTAETTTVLPENQQQKWYRSEQISGNIEIGDFVVGPGLAELEAKPGETIIQEITVTNRISGDRTFKIEVEDITGTSDGSRSVNLSGEERGPYSIRDYISFPSDTFTLTLGERARIPITITIPSDAEPGGFYGSVLISTDRTNESSTVDGPRQPLIARIGTLIFLTVGGDIERSGKTLEIKTVTDSAWYEKGPIDMAIIYENTGSVHVNPYGELTVTNMFGEQVGFVELEPWFVLPKSLRSREITWDREFLLGRYTVTAKVNRGYDNIVDEVSTSFWVLPWKIVAGAFAVIFIIIFGIRTFFRKFEFKKR